jgi:hypothetical protein
MVVSDSDGGGILCQVRVLKVRVVTMEYSSEVFSYRGGHGGGVGNGGAVRRQWCRLNHRRS